MASTRYIDMVLRALEFRQRTDIWVAIGRTAAWDEEQNPPATDPETELDTPIVYVRPENVQLMKAVDADGDFVDDAGQNYAFVAEEDALAENARFVFVHAEFSNADGQPHPTFRQAALVTHLQTAPGYENYPWVTPEQVSDPGYVRWIANFEPQSGNAQSVKIPIEFR